LNRDRSASGLYLEDGSFFPGESAGYPIDARGEAVFNTGMVGYPEALTDPSYRGQILVLTYPLIGNYGVPEGPFGDARAGHFESSALQVSGLIVSELAETPSHWSSRRSLRQWLRDERVPALAGVDTRALTKHLRAHGSMRARICCNGAAAQHGAFARSGALVSQVSIAAPRLHRAGDKRVVLVDCGCKNNIVRSLLERNVSVLQVPWDYDFLSEPFDGLLISNGPGDPTDCVPTIDNVRRAFDLGRPILGICLGHQILALAAGARTYKMKYGHRSQNQPCLDLRTGRCHITSQNHGYAVDDESIPADWLAWFVNANDGSNEGLRHRFRPFMSVQFHPEAAPGPMDSRDLFDAFTSSL
jgi:carbamoyl-phosphate synthase small subunit